MVTDAATPAGPDAPNPSSYEIFKQNHLPSDEVRVKSVSRVGSIDGRAQSIRYTYTYELEMSTDKSGQEYWYHVITHPKSDIVDFKAEDSEGSLKSDFLSNHSNSTEARIFFRRQQRQQKFSFSYKVPLPVLHVSQVFRKIYFYRDWLTHTTNVEKLSMTTVLPANAKILEKFPKLNPNLGVIEYQNLPQFAEVSETMMFALPTIGRAAAAFLALVVGSALLGAVFTDILKFLTP